MAVDLDIFAIDSTIHGFNGKKKKGSDQDEIAGGNNLTDLFSILEEEKNEKQHTGDIGNQNCVPNSSDNLHPFFMLDDEDGNIRDETKKSNDDMIDIFALDNDQQQSHPIKCIDFNDAKYNRGKRESIASLEHYNADFIAYFSDDTTEDFEYYAKNLEEPQDLSTELFNLEPNQNLSDEEVLDRSSGDYADDEHDKSFKIHDDNEEEEQDTSIILETTDDSKSDTVSESSDIYTVEEEEYYNGSDTSTIESSDVEESAEEEVRQVMEKQEETADEDREDSDVQEESTSSEDAPEHEHAWWLKDDVVIMLFPGDSMKIRTLNDLLPDFQNFLDDLCQIKLTSDLEDKAKDYRQRISDYIEQFSSQPGQVPPPLPETSTSTFQLDPDVNLEDLLAKERDKSRLNFASSTLPTLNGHTTHGEFTSEVVDEVSKRHSMPPGFRLSKRLSGHFLSKRRSLINEPPGEDFYEAPMDQKPTQKPPPVPDSVRPVTTAGIVRQIDDLPTYDDPDSPQNPSPPPVTGLPPRLPNSNQGYHVLNPEGQDSGGTFSTGTETTGHFSDDGELYEDLNEDDDSFSDGYDSDELEPINPDPEFVSGKTKTKKKDKDDSYWQNFVNFIESENNTCDHKGKLYFYDAKSTLNKLFKPKVYFCAATNARLLCYLPKKEYGKPQIDIPLQSSCEISSTGKDGGKEYGIQVQVKKGKVYSFNCTTSLEADKWVETLKKYTNQGLEYDVTPCTGDSGDGEVVSPPPGMEDPMFSKTMNNTHNISHNMDIISEFIVETIMKRVFKNKKNKKHSPQITEEDGAVHGYANVLGAFYGEPKWQKKWIVIKNHQFSCHKSKSDDYEFAFSLKDVELGAPEQKIVKKGREGALKFSKDNETLIYLEALNPLDVGKIMKQALNAMMVSSAATKGNLVRRETTVEKITKFYEALEQGVTEQPFARRKKDSTDDKKELDEEPEEEPPKKGDKKKKDKKDKKKKKKLRKDEIEHPDEPPPDPPVDVPPAKQPLTRQLSDPPHDESKSEPIIQEEPEPEPPKRPLTRQLTENKFKDSDKKHLLDADRLQVEKKEVEAKKKELSDRKKEIQNKKKTIDDPTERQNLDLQFKNVQSEWSQCSKRLAVIEDEIEKATKAAVPQYYVIYGRPTSYYDTLPLLKSVSPTETQLMKNSPASLRRGAGDSSDSRRSSGSSSRGEGSIGMTLASMTSPERECATSDMSLQEKIKRFQKK
ncbi:uncharacterized protein [Amphiura filiformis]|uniref:uncharacterized protein isoform X11 n=1 Tax=Amphiura filiformis TaxID=82378 RepID=UPI003B221870